MIPPLQPHSGQHTKSKNDNDGLYNLDIHALSPFETGSRMMITISFRKNLFSHLIMMPSFLIETGGLPPIWGLRQECDSIAGHVLLKAGIW
jgi:hypothetical protein